MVDYLPCDWPKEMRTSVACPQCGAEIVYNGNYFCSQFAYEGNFASVELIGGVAVGDPCDWSMPDLGVDDPLFVACYSGLMANRGAKR